MGWEGLIVEATFADDSLNYGGNWDFGKLGKC